MAEIKAWITVKGRHIPIMEGESKEDAIKRLKEGARAGKETRPHTHDSMRKKAQEHKKAEDEYKKSPWKANAAENKVEADDKFRKESDKGIINKATFNGPKDKEDFVVGNNPPTEKEQAWMNAKAIKISKHMPKEKQAELRKLKKEYQKQYKTWQDKDEETKKKQIAVSEKQKAERNSGEKSPYHSTRKSSDRLLNPINEHEYRVSNNEDVKSAIQDASKRIFDNEELIGHAMQMKYDNMEGFWYRGSAVVTRRKNGWNLSPDDTGGARKALMQAHYEVTGETKKPGNKFNYKDRETARKVFEKSSYIMSKLEDEEKNDKKTKKK